MNLGQRKMNRLERLAKYLERETRGEIGYKMEGNNIKIVIRNAKTTTERGIIYIISKQAIIRLHQWLRERQEDIVNIGIETERRQIAVIFKGNVNVEQTENNVIITLEPKSKVDIFSS